MLPSWLVPSVRPLKSTRASKSRTAELPSIFTCWIILGLGQTHNKRMTDNTFAKNYSIFENNKNIGPSPNFQFFFRIVNKMSLFKYKLYNTFKSVPSIAFLPQCVSFVYSSMSGKILPKLMWISIHFRSTIGVSRISGKNCIKMFFQRWQPFVLGLFASSMSKRRTTRLRMSFVTVDEIAPCSPWFEENSF